jgi:Ca2+-binding EF-hand superfamily protein
MGRTGKTNESSISFGFVAEKKEAPVQEEEYHGLVGGPPEAVASLLRELKASLASHGARGIAGLARKFKIIDDSDNGFIEFSEFKKAIGEHTLSWTNDQVHDVFNFFDKDHSGSIDYDEFLYGIRGNLNQRREQVVLLAFGVMDRDKNGFIDLDDIVRIYNADSHPDVLSGKKTKAQVLLEFLDTFDGGEKDGKVTPAEFCKYYSNISASIDEDDYFELVIRNAWHISGGEGQFANTTCRRVLVTHEDGKQTVEEIKDDFAMDKNDTAAMRANLAAQGIHVKSIELTTNMEPEKKNNAQIAHERRTKQMASNLDGPARGKSPGRGKSPNRGKSPGRHGAQNNAQIAHNRRGQVLQSSIVLGQPVQDSKTTGPAITLESAASKNPELPPHTAFLLEKMRYELNQHGASGIAGLGRKFQIIDDNGNGFLEYSEFKKACRELTLDWTEQDIRELFNFFDTNKSGNLDYDEFLVGLRGQLNQRRTQLVLLAFSVLDRDRSGIIEVNDIIGLYDASQHPDVIAGRKTKGQVFREFLDNFDVTDKDGKVTPGEFCKYYSNVSASIDDDDYFELMIRNAWHISGGEGQFANTTCKRVLVTHEDGKQTVEEIKDDFGMDQNDTAAMKANLAAQGINAKAIDTTGSTSGETPVEKKNNAQVAHERRGKAMQSTPLW